MRSLPAVLALAVALAAMPGHAQVETLEVVVAESDAELSALAAPDGAPVTVCDGSACPSPLTRAVAQNVRVGTDGRRIEVQADVRVTASLPLVGSRTTTIPITCDGEPELDGSRVLHLRRVHCDAGSVPGISSALGALLASDLEARTVDVGAEIDRGALERHSGDRRVSHACAAACVTGASLVQPLESGGHAHVAVRVTVAAPSCCP